jgi:hypothetical protein
MADDHDSYRRTIPWRAQTTRSASLLGAGIASMAVALLIQISGAVPAFVAMPFLLLSVGLVMFSRRALRITDEPAPESAADIEEFTSINRMSRMLIYSTILIAVPLIWFGLEGADSPLHFTKLYAFAALLIAFVAARLWLSRRAAALLKSLRANAFR